MGRNKETAISSEVNGSVGGQTFYRWRGEKLVRMKGSGKRTMTSKQLSQQVIFAELMDWSGIFGEVAALGFPRRPRKQSPENAFAQANAGIVTQDAEGGVVVDYARIACSEGTLKEPEMTATFDAEEGSLAFTHVAEVKGHRRYGDDRLFVALLNKKEKEVLVHELNQRKDATPATLQLPNDWETADLCIYAFYLRSDGGRASGTTYVELA